MDERNFFSKKFFKLNQVIVDVIDNYSTMNFHQLNIEEEESVHELQMTIDNMVQYDENRMPNDKHFMDNAEDEGDPSGFMAEAGFGGGASAASNMM